MLLNSSVNATSEKCELEQEADKVTQWRLQFKSTGRIRPTVKVHVAMA